MEWILLSSTSNTFTFSSHCLLEILIVGIVMTLKIDNTEFKLKEIIDNSWGNLNILENICLIILDQFLWSMRITRKLLDIKFG